MSIEKEDLKSLNIYQRMLMATGEIATVAKNLDVSMGKDRSYKAVGEADVLRAVKPIEEKFGIYSFPVDRKIIETNILTTVKEYNGNKTETNQLFMRLEVIYRFVNVDKPEEFIDIKTYGDGVDSGDKAPGKSMTYADKYALLKAYKIQTGEDPDQEGSGDLKKVEKPKVDKKTLSELVGLVSQEEIDRVCAYYKIGDLKDLTQENAIAWLNKKKGAING